MTKSMKYLILTLSIFMSTTTFANDTIVAVKSPYSVEQTSDRLEAIIKEKGLNFFARINHAANAEKVELELRPTELLLFGNPAAGTPIMNCAQTAAIDLPQKALIWEDENQQVWLGYNPPSYLQKRHDIEGCEPVLEKVTGLLANLAAAATATE